MIEHVKRWFRPGRVDLFGIVKWQDLRPVPTRLRCAWAALRGRPVAYRLHIKGGIDCDSRTVVAECVMDGGYRTDYAIKVGGGQWSPDAFKGVKSWQ